MDVLELDVLFEEWKLRDDSRNGEMFAEEEASKESPTFTGTRSKDECLRLLKRHDTPLDPASLFVCSEHHWTVQDLEDVMLAMKQQRDKRVPLPVLKNKKCLVCWQPSAALCVRCKLWSLCGTCKTELEGNCLQCLWTDQEATAREALKRRVTFHEASLD